MLTEKQISERKLGIGGSDIPIIMGLSTYKTPYQLYLDKIGEPEPKDMTQLQYWGNQLESVVRDEFSKRNGVEVECPETMVHPDYEFLRGNVDGFIKEWNAILEVKCSSSFMANEWGESGSDVIPLPYILQVAHYCAVADADCAHIAVLIGGNDYREFKYMRDTQIEERVISEARKFWDCVQSGVPPEPRTQLDLRLMFPQHDPNKIKSVSGPIYKQIATLADTKFKIKELGEIEEKHKFSIMQFMQDAEVLVNEFGEPIVSWKANKRGSRTFLMKGI